MSTTRIIVKNTSLNLVNLFSIAVFAFLTSIVVARSLGPDRMGVYSYLLWVLEIGSVAVNLGLLNTGMRYIGEALGRHELELARHLSGRFFKIEISLGLVISALIVLFSIFGRNLFDARAAAPMLLLPIALLPASLNNFFNAINRGWQRFGAIAWSGVLTSLASFLLIWWTASRTGDLSQIILWLAVANALGLAIYVGAFSRIERSALITKNIIEGNLKRRLVRYSLALSVLVVCELIVWQKSEVFFLAFFTDSQTVAFYSLAFTMALAAVAYLPNAFISLLTPMVSSRFGQFNEIGVIENFSAAALRYVLFLAVPLAVGVTLLIHPIVTFLYGPAYQSVSSVFPLLALASVGSVITGVFSASLLGMERQKIFLFIILGVTVVNLILDFSLIPVWGLMGAALANLSAQLGACFLSAIYLRQRIGFRLLDWPWLARLTAASAIIGLSLWPISQLADAGLAVSLGALVWVGATYSALWLTRCWQAQDLERFDELTEGSPTLRKIVRFILKPVYWQLNHRHHGPAASV